MTKLGSPRVRFLLVLAAAAVLAAVLIGASRLGSEAEKAAAPPPAEAAPTATAGAAAPRERMFPGIPQQGAALGRPSAPVTLVEYADLQCPYCGEWARTTLPVLVSDYVRTGKLRIVFRGLAFVGPDSQRALTAAVAAGRQNRLWDVVDSLYLRQGTENTGWANDALLSDVAQSIAGLDENRLDRDRGSAAVQRDIASAARAAQAAGIGGTPSFQVGPTGGRLELVQISSLGPEGIRPAIEAAAAR